jgi:hypothetical protein
MYICIIGTRETSPAVILNVFVLGQTSNPLSPDDVFFWRSQCKDVARKTCRRLNDEPKEAHHGCCKKSAKYEEPG